MSPTLLSILPRNIGANQDAGGVIGHRAIHVASPLINTVDKEFYLVQLRLSRVYLTAFGYNSEPESGLKGVRWCFHLHFLYNIILLLQRLAHDDIPSILLYE